MRLLRFSPWNFREEWRQDLRQFLVFYGCAFMVFMALLG
jgi:hypothetical protein